MKTCEGCSDPMFADDPSDFCSKLCRIATEAGFPSYASVPKPPLPVKGLLGAFTERPGEQGCYATQPSVREPTLDLCSYATPVLSTDSEERKNTPIFSGVLNYFPLAIAAVARLSKRGNDKHNPGEPLHWARDKSTDQEDCIARHLIDIDTFDPRTNEYEDAVALAWRALAKLQDLEEKRLGKPRSRGSR